MNNNLESVLKEYQDNILKLRNVYTRIEQKLKKVSNKKTQIYSWIKSLKK
jgi:hypothetical protein